jgi:hypothetical protein
MSLMQSRSAQTNNITSRFLLLIRVNAAMMQASLLTGGIKYALDYCMPSPTIHLLLRLVRVQVYGSVKQHEGGERFEWSHSYSRVYEPRGRYSPTGIFMSFEHYNVEYRERVKCITGIDG